MKIVFFGTGNFSRNILAGIFDKVEVSLVVSQPDKKVGRKQEIEETAIKTFAKQKNLQVLQPEKLRGNEEFFAKLRDLNPDFIVVVAYGKIIPKEILEIPKYDCINIHGSILPAYRGASPVQESLKNGDKKTGLTIMKMSEGMDEGDILNIKEVEILEDDKTPQIFEKFEKIGSNLLLNTLEMVVNNTIIPIKQDNSKATYCSKIEKEDGKIDFFQDTATEIYNKFRAYYVWPKIFTIFKNKRIVITECHLENGKLILDKVKPEGKNEMNYRDFVNGNGEFGSCFG